MPEVGTTPPRPRLILRVGVTGHRADKLDAMDSEALSKQLARIFKLMQSALQDAHQSAPEAFSSDTPLIRIISPLADGADQIVADEAIKHEFELQSPLPFLCPENPKEAEKNYGKNLENASAVLELDGSHEKQEIAYEAAGRMVLRHSDILIAIWDKENARGIGGTGQIVEEARKISIPTIRIDHHKPHKVTLLVPNNSETWDSTDISRLPDILKPELLPPKEKAISEHEHHHDSASDLRSTYFSEKIPGFTIGILWKLFHSYLVHGRIWFPKAKQKEPQWSDEIETWSNVSKEAKVILTKVIDQIEAKLRAHYEYADALANHYSNLYHAGFVWNYLMSGFAVLFAFLAFAHHNHSLSFAELFAIGSIILVYFANKKKKWYDRRIDYRLLAELIRQTRFLATLGRIPPLSPPQPIHSHYGDPSGSWVQWHFQGIVKELGMASAKFSSQYLGAVVRLIKSETQKQAEYHERKSKENFKINKWLHRWSIRMFFLAVIGCSYHVLPVQSIPYVGSYLKAHKEIFNLIFSMLSIVGPAFGAAFAGIRSQGEFERVARHSVAMAEYLKEKTEELSQIEHVTNLNSNVLARITDDISEKMIEEMLDWRIVFHDRPIELA